MENVFTFYVLCSNDVFTLKRFVENRFFHFENVPYLCVKPFQNDHFFFLPLAIDFNTYLNYLKFNDFYTFFFF